LDEGLNSAYKLVALTIINSAKKYEEFLLTVLFDN